MFNVFMHFARRTRLSCSASPKAVELCFQYIYVYIYIYIYIYIYVYIHIVVCIYIYRERERSIYIYIYVHIDVYIYMVGSTIRSVLGLATQCDLPLVNFEWTDLVMYVYVYIYIHTI